MKIVLLSVLILSVNTLCAQNDTLVGKYVVEYERVIVEDGRRIPGQPTRLDFTISKKFLIVEGIKYSLYKEIETHSNENIQHPQRQRTIDESLPYIKSFNAKPNQIVKVTGNVDNEKKIIYKPKVIRVLSYKFQATSAKQEVFNNKQCSSTGIGIGSTSEEADKNAESNRIKALERAKVKGYYSFSTKDGAGSCLCKEVKKK